MRSARPSPSPRKAWIETPCAFTSAWKVRSPSPRKAWIETQALSTLARDGPSPSPRKAWIETVASLNRRYRLLCRLPPGRRGLKHVDLLDAESPETSPSPRKAWIETSSSQCGASGTESPSPRKAWIETCSTPRYRSLPASPSPRKAWIETETRRSLTRRASTSPSPRKAWIETASTLRPPARRCGRLPPGRRGLKLYNALLNAHRHGVAFPPEGVD